MNKKRLLRIVINIATLAGLALAARQYLSGEAFLAAFGRFNYLYLPLMLVLSASYLLAKAYRFVLMMQPVSKLPQGVFLRGYLAGAAASLVPGGVSIRAGLMKQAGAPVSHSTPAVAFSSLLDQVLFVVGSLLAALVYPPIRPAAIGVLAAFTLTFFLLLIPGLRRLISSGLEWVARRFRIADHYASFLTALRDVFTWKIMAAGLAISAASILVMVAIFQLSLRGLGLAVAYPVVLLAYVVPTFLGRVASTPGGVGVTEAGMVGFLSGFAGLDPEPALAAAAIFRVSTVMFQAALGAVVYGFFWRGEREAPPAKDKGKDHASESHL
jgi:uncharacterized protein (TIRG00374 family)